MYKYIFILGQSPKLATQEINSLFNADQQSIISTGNNFVLANISKKSTEIIDSLGGTVKIARLVDQLDNLDQLTVEKWQEYISLQLEPDHKINFGFSLYSNKKQHPKIHKLALELKRHLKDQGYKSRLVSSRQPELSSVIVSKEKLIEKELVLIFDKNKWLVGITEAVQDFVKYGHRDMKRPQRDDKSGMLPPKLAQMMINLAGPERDKVLLDPFCGSGTVLQEAALLGFNKLYGSDNSKKAISDSFANLEWLKNNFAVSPEIKLEKTDVKLISKVIKNQSINLIVTEPFMGDARFVKKQNKVSDLEDLRNELQELYLEAFNEFKKIIKTDGKIIFVFPSFHLKSNYLPTLDETIISKLGFELIHNIEYSRPEQKVLRQITVWQIKK